jgi:hypothetical protein
MIKPLSPKQCRHLAEQLPDIPETVIATSQLRRGVANAWLAGEGTASETAVVEDQNQPGEPLIFGQDPTEIARVLPHIPNWDCVNVSPTLAPELAALIEKQMNCPVRLWHDVYHTLTKPGPNFFHSQIRLLTPDDWPLLAAAPTELQGPNPRRALFEMQVAGGVIDGRLVAIAQKVATSAKYAEIGVHTLSDYRNQGFSTALASLIATDIQAQGLTAVWSCGEGNAASMRVAQKLGFTEVSRRVYLILVRGN